MIHPEPLPFIAAGVSNRLIQSTISSRFFHASDVKYMAGMQLWENVLRE
jgi:hypothetical protein